MRARTISLSVSLVLSLQVKVEPAFAQPVSTSCTEKAQQRCKDQLGENHELCISADVADCYWELAQREYELYPRCQDRAHCRLVVNLLALAREGFVRAFLGTDRVDEQYDFLLKSVRCDEFAAKLVHDSGFEVGDAESILEDTRTRIAGSLDVFADDVSYSRKLLDKSDELQATIAEYIAGDAEKLSDMASEARKGNELSTAYYTLLESSERFKEAARRGPSKLFCSYHKRRLLTLLQADSVVLLRHSLDKEIDRIVDRALTEGRKCPNQETIKSRILIGKRLRSVRKLVSDAKVDSRVRPASAIKKFERAASEYSEIFWDSISEGVVTQEERADWIEERALDVVISYESAEALMRVQGKPTSSGRSLLYKAQAFVRSASERFSNDLSIKLRLDRLRFRIEEEIPHGILQPERRLVLTGSVFSGGGGLLLGGMTGALIVGYKSRGVPCTKESVICKDDDARQNHSRGIVANRMATGFGIVGGLALTTGIVLLGIGLKRAFQSRRK